MLSKIYELPSLNSRASRLEYLLKYFDSSNTFLKIPLIKEKLLD
jgi:hypothetical protein